MALDFPNNPSRDELFFAEGTTWKWTGVAWAIVGGDGTPTEIVGADTSAGWQVWGDTLIQWGVATADAGGSTGAVTFPKQFKTNPRVVAVAQNNTVVDAVCRVNGPPSTTFTVFFAFRSSTQAGLASDVAWIAIGEALDADKKAKVVHSANGESAGGGGASVVVGEVPPENPSQGDMWFATGESVGLYVWYGDEDSSQWVMTNGGGRALNAVQRTGDTMTGPLVIDGASLTVKGPLVVEDADLTVTGNRILTAPRFIVQPDASDVDHARYYFFNKAGAQRALIYFDNDDSIVRTQLYDAAGVFKAEMRFKSDPVYAGMVEADTFYATSKLIGTGPSNAGKVGTRQGGTVNFGYTNRGGQLSLEYQIDEQTVFTAATSVNANSFGYAGGTGGPTGVSLNGTDNGGQLYGIFVDAVSDQRIKQNIAPTQLNALDLINTIEMVEYDYTPEYMATLTGDTWKDVTPDQHVRIGLVTQQLKTLVPEAVHENPHKALDIDDLQTWSPEALVPYLIKAVQQLTARVEELENANGT